VRFILLRDPKSYHLNIKVVLIKNVEISAILKKVFIYGDAVIYLQLLFADFSFDFEYNFQFPFHLEVGFFIIK